MVDLKQQHVHSSYFLNCRKMPQYILKAGGRENASTWLVFHVQNGVSSVENAGYSGCPAVSRTGEGAEQVKELVFGNRRITAFGLIMCWKFHLDHLTAFW